MDVGDVTGQVGVDVGVVGLFVEPTVVFRVVVGTVMSAVTRSTTMKNSCDSRSISYWISHPLRVGGQTF